MSAPLTFLAPAGILETAPCACWRCRGGAHHPDRARCGNRVRVGARSTVCDACRANRRRHPLIFEAFAWPGDFVAFEDSVAPVLRVRPGVRAACTRAVFGSLTVRPLTTCRPARQ